MLDIQTAPASPPPVIRREDYRPPDWLVPDVSLTFALDPAATRVSARLDGHAQRRRMVARCGSMATGWRRSRFGSTAPRRRRAGGWKAARCVIDLPGDAHVIETEVEIAPERNTQLMGLYASGGMLCTQCEPEGFRRITFFPDRPDVLSRYTVRLEADETLLPATALERRPDRRRRARGRAALGRMARSRSPSRPICSRWSPPISPPIATASRRDRAARSISPSG